MIVRSERLVGRTLQGRYDGKTDEYNQSQGPTQVPFDVGVTRNPLSLKNKLPNFTMNLIRL